MPEYSAGPNFLAIAARQVFKQKEAVTYKCHRLCKEYCECAERVILLSASLGAKSR